MAQEAQKTTAKPSAPKPGPAPKGIPQPTVLGKETKKEEPKDLTAKTELPKETKPKDAPEETPAEATIKDFSLEEAKLNGAQPATAAAKSNTATPVATSAAPIKTATPLSIATVAAEPYDVEAKLTREIEARLSREIEARLRKELEPRIAKELESKLLRQFDNQLQKVVNDSVERALERRSQPNLQTISKEEIASTKAAMSAPRKPTPVAFKAVGAITEPAKQERVLTPAELAISPNPSQPSMPKIITPPSLAVAKPGPANSLRVPTPSAFPATNIPVSSPAQEFSARTPFPVSPAAHPEEPKQAPQRFEASSTPIAPAEPTPQANVWTQDPAQQKAFQTQQIRTNKIRVSLDDVSPERLNLPAEDLGREFLKDAGVSKGNKVAVLMLLILAVVGSAGFGVYYVYGKQVPNPPRAEVVHAAIAGLERGTVNFTQGGSEIPIIYQPPTMLLGQVKGKRPPTTVAPKATPTPPTPKVTPPKPTTPPAGAPKLKVVPKEN